MSPSATGVAFARAGLLGNPSDGYGGKAIALSVCNFRARVEISPARHFVIHPGPTDLHEFATLREATDAFQAVGCEDGLRLVRAAVRRFAGHWAGLSDLAEADPRLRIALRYDTDIPRQVGLSGSSAIVTATLRALMAWFGVEIAPAELAELALAAELEDLRIAAGPMDRVIQAYEGLMLMDLREPRSEASYRRLDPGLLPALFVAWDPRGGEPSGKAHGELRARWESGDEELRGVMRGFRDIVDSGVSCLERGDFDGFRRLVDRNFETRARFFPISERDREMISIARGCGAAAKLCGSGGSIIGVPVEASLGSDQERTFQERGFGFLRPRLSPPPETIPKTGAGA